jgi:hypothetical protein
MFSASLLNRDGRSSIRLAIRDVPIVGREEMGGDMAGNSDVVKSGGRFVFVIGKWDCKSARSMRVLRIDTAVHTYSPVFGYVSILEMKGIGAKRVGVWGVSE